MCWERSRQEYCGWQGHGRSRSAYGPRSRGWGEEAGPHSGIFGIVLHRTAVVQMTTEGQFFGGVGLVVVNEGRYVRLVTPMGG